jgi:hypothetical protein
MACREDYAEVGVVLTREGGARARKLHSSR